MANDVANQLSGLIKYVKSGLNEHDPTVIGILVALCVVFLTIVFLAFWSRSKNKRSSVLILGVCDAGKTGLFTRLVHGIYKQTYTSIAPNSGEYMVPSKNKSLRILDLPGHERVRLQTLEQHKRSARAVIYIVDSANLQKEVKEVAEYLYTVLSDSVISSHAPPVLIACNKQDLTLSKGMNVIRSQLEKEMNTLRVTKSASLQGQDDVGNNNTFLGKRNKDFSFSDLKPITVDFVECTAQGKDDTSDTYIKQVEDWLVKVA